MSTLINLPSALKLSNIYFPPGSAFANNKITLTTTNTVQPHTLYLPSQNSFGFLQNDGAGKLRWSDTTQQITTVTNVNVASNTNTGLIQLTQSGTGSSCITFNVTPGSPAPSASYSFGIDAAHGNAFKLSQSNWIGTNDIITFSTTALTIPTNLVMSETNQAGTQGALTMGTCNLRALNATNNLFLGNNAGNLTFTSAIDNLGIGKETMRGIVDGSGNVAAGSNALYSVISGNYNSAFGIKSLYNNLTSNNSAYGYRSLYYCTTGTYNCAFGSNTLSNIGTGSYNTAVGGSIGFALNTGTYNSFLGYNASTNTGARTNATAIGANSIVTDNNRVQLGDTSVASIGFGPNILTTNQIGQLTHLFDSPSVLLSNANWVSLGDLTQQVSATSSPTFANLTVSGVLNAGSITMSSIKSSVSLVSTTGTLGPNQSIVKCNASSAPFILSLPASTAYPTIEYKLVKVDSTSNIITIYVNGTDTIDFTMVSFNLCVQGDTIHLVSTGDGNWIIM